MDLNEIRIFFPGIVVAPVLGIFDSPVDVNLVELLQWFPGLLKLFQPIRGNTYFRSDLCQFLHSQNALINQTSSLLPELPTTGESSLPKCELQTTDFGSGTRTYGAIPGSY